MSIPFPIFKREKSEEHKRFDLVLEKIKYFEIMSMYFDFIEECVESSDYLIGYRNYRPRWEETQNWIYKKRGIKKLFSLFKSADEIGYIVINAKVDLDNERIDFKNSLGLRISPLKDCKKKDLEFLAQLVEKVDKRFPELKARIEKI